MRNAILSSLIIHPLFSTAANCVLEFPKIKMDFPNLYHVHYLCRLLSSILSFHCKCVHQTWACNSLGRFPPQSFLSQIKKHLWSQTWVTSNDLISSPATPPFSHFGLLVVCPSDRPPPSLPHSGPHLPAPHPLPRGHRVRRLERRRAVCLRPLSPLVIPKV